MEHKAQKSAQYFIESAVSTINFVNDLINILWDVIILTPNQLLFTLAPKLTCVLWGETNVMLSGWIRSRIKPMNVRTRSDHVSHNTTLR
jgi:hypothetical protein